jgi:hypothetical protein
MIWNNVAAIPDVLLVGRNATIVNDHPNNVREYIMQNKNSRNGFTCLKIAKYAIITIIMDTVKHIKKKWMNQAR